MGLFKNLASDGLEEAQDRLGGGFRPLDSDVYAGKIKLAYAGKSDGGAQNVTVVLALENGTEYRETVYVTNKKGENFYVDNSDAKKKQPLPGFTTIDDLCQVSLDKPLCEVDTEEKVLNIWDYEQRKELPKSVEVLTDLHGKDCLVAIQKVLENKKGPAPDFAPTAETREFNTIAKVFHPELRCTVGEAKRGKTTGDDLFIEQWVERNKGETYDKRTIKDGGGAQSGKPGAKGGNNAGPPQAGEGSNTRKSLFGAKK